MLDGLRVSDAGVCVWMRGGKVPLEEIAAGLEEIRKQGELMGRD